jgi:serine/threonine protein kinase
MAGKTRKHYLRRRNSSRRRYKGGRFLGKGTYGCTFGFPPLKCVGEPVRKSGEYISKYVVKKEARVEGIKSKWFKRFDPSDTYFLTASAICDLDTADIQPTNEFGNCHIPIAPGNKLIFFKNAGVDLSNFIPTPDQMIPFYQSLPHLFDGLSLAHRNRTYHRDIKLANVVTMRQPDGSFLTRFIDLGMGVTHPIKQITAAEYYGYFYVYWPFDIHFIYRDRSTVKTRLNRLVDGEDFSKAYPPFLNEITKYIPTVSYPFFKADKSPFVTYDQMLTILMSPENLRLSLEKRIELADIYSLGILILQCFRYLGLTIKDDGVSPKVLLTVVDSYNILYQIEIDGLVAPPFSFDISIIEWFHTISREIYVPVLQLVKEMCSPDPTQRMDLVIAKIFFETEILRKLDVYLTGPQVQAALDAFTAIGWYLYTE